MAEAIPQLEIAVPPHPIGREAFQCRGEAAMREAVLARGPIVELRDRLNASPIDPGSTRRDLLKTAMKISPSMSPSLHALVAVARKVLDVGARTFDLFVYPSVDVNAYVSPAPGGQAYHVVLSSTLIEKFSRRETLAILSHEIGHAVCDHTEFPIQRILGEGCDVLSTLDVYRLMALSRYQEITADRASLLACQDYAIAAGCLLKAASGVTSDALRFDLAEYLAQLEEIRSLQDVNESSEDWFASHPFSPLRVKALQLFSESEPYRRLIGQGDGGLTPAELEDRIDELLSIMNPSYLSVAEEEIQRDIREWLVLAGVLVARADGEVGPDEVARLAERVGAEHVQPRIPELVPLAPDDLRDQLRQRAEALHVRTPNVLRAQIVRDLVVVSLADGTIDDAELNELAGIAGLLGIAPFYVQQVADEMRQPVAPAI